MKALAAALIIATLFAGQGFVNRMGAEDEIRKLQAETTKAQQWALVTRPLCQFYFEWSAQLHDRVPGMEQHCGNSIGATP